MTPVAHTRSLRVLRAFHAEHDHAAQLPHQPHPLHTPQQRRMQSPPLGDVRPELDQHVLLSARRKQ